MTDLAVPEPGDVRVGRHLDKATRKATPFATLALLLILIGLAGGVIGFWGYFVNIVHQPNTNLYRFSSVWYDLIPISIGLGTIGLALPGALKAFTSGLPLMAMGIVFGIHALYGETVRTIPTSSWGWGFYMMLSGAGVLTLSSWSLVALSLWRTRRRLQELQGTRPDG